MTHKGTLPLETKRLILRRFTEADADTMFHNCWRNHDVWKWTNYQPMKSLDDLYTLNNIFTEFWFAKYCNLAYYNWAIVSKETKEAIGRIWAVRTDEKLQQAELAYELGVHWWNQGLMTEAVNAIISFLFSEIGYNRIYADHASGNPASGSVMKKCNMQYEGTQRQALCCNAGLFDKVNYAILAEEYFKEANS